MIMRTNNIYMNNNNNNNNNNHNINNNNNNNNKNNNNNIMNNRNNNTTMGHNNHNPNMIARTTSYPLRILVHSDAVGAIIGRSGSTIKTITQQTKARIDVHREESPEHQEKVITINGSPDSCSEACLKIIEVVRNEMNSKYEGAADPNRDLTLKILAASNLIGRLIGKNGSTIKKIMEQTATRVNISTNIITESTGEHTVIIVGKLEQVHQAERLISSKLRTAFMSDMNTSLQSMSQQPYLFNNVILPYMPGPYAQNSILASIVNPQTGHGSNTMPRNMPIAANHQGQIQNPVYTPNASAYLPFYSNLNAPPAASGLLGFNPVAPGYEQERETVHIHIPSSMVGAIIGKSGTAIKEMISMSGASIKVATTPTTPEPESSDQNRDQNNTKANININNNNNNNSNSETANNLSPEAPSQSCTADSSLTTGSSMSPKVSRHQANSANDGTQRISTRKVIIVGYPASQYSAQYMIYRRISIESGKGDISLMVEIYIPSQFVGRIIGKGGSTVKQLQKQTRTTIRLPEDKSSSLPSSQDDSNCVETCVQITGEFEGSIAAQRQIRNMVREGLVSRQIRLQQQVRNNESSVTKNNAQTNNHQQSDSENETRHRNNGDDEVDEDDKTTNEKSTDKFVHDVLANDPMYVGSVSC
uniref:Insulin-like growth factor 2 mRNA-binding protein 1 n=1 Tax=Aceria tosichella TaxID=561515 RepID=A0A6G1SFS2_9ACAR